MFDRLNLPASLRHLLEKRFTKDRRERVRRKPDATNSSESSEDVPTSTTSPDGHERREEADRRVSKRRTAD